MRFPVVLFDLDGTVVDSGGIILASMRHATQTVLRREYSDAELLVNVGGPGLEAQMHALDPPGDPTVGASLAADLSGPRRHRYGAMRDLVIGVTVVLPGGLIASSGGTVVKNVAATGTPARSRTIQ